MKNYTLFIGLLYPWSNVSHVRGYNFYCSVNLGENLRLCFNAFSDDVDSILLEVFFKYSAKQSKDIKAAIEVNI